MDSEALDIEFREAVDSINSHQEPFPADVLLKLYAYYSKAIINAIKTNALFQVEDITQDQAKQHYIKLANTYLIYRK
jgi:acyl-CoA-binding protein